MQLARDLVSANNLAAVIESNLFDDLGFEVAERDPLFIVRLPTADSPVLDAIWMTVSFLWRRLIHADVPFIGFALREARIEPWPRAKGALLVRLW
jgi:hypothetical protein